jgi:hypothetical protein
MATHENSQTPDDCDRDLEALVEKATDAFWDVVVRHYPDAESGDLSPERTIAFHALSGEVIREWIRNNVAVRCKTCASEIHDGENDGVFAGGECEWCERTRYESQPRLLAALDQLLEQTIDADLAQGIGLTDSKRAAYDAARSALAAAHDTSTSR